MNVESIPLQSNSTPRGGWAQIPNSEPEDDDRAELRHHQVHRFDRGMLTHVLLLSCTALVPAFLGAAFWVSLGLERHGGQYYHNNMTYIRPSTRDTRIFGVEIKAIGPLLISSLSSSTIDLVSGFVTLLLAYHMAHLWIHSQAQGNAKNLPSSYQYFLTMSLVDNPRPMALFYSVQHMLATRRSSRKTLAPMFVLAFAGAFFVIALSWGLKAVDIILHDRITPTVQWHPVPYAELKVDAAIANGCADPQVPLCPVEGRANEARLGGLNQSEVLSVYTYSDSTNASVGSLAYIGPSALSVNTSIHRAHTYAAGTTCQVYHPTCYVEQMAISACSPSPSYDVGNYPLYSTTYANTTTMKWYMQTYLLQKGNVTTNQVPLSNGANVNPLNFATWGCFDDYADIVHDDGNTYPFKGPFINWWQYGQGIGNKPYKLCSLLFCNTTVYDATYSTFAGNWSVDADSLQLANASTTLAISGGSVFLGTGGWALYEYAFNYMDEMLQIDLSAAGNTYGNDSVKFAQAWAMGLSSRLLGWSAGAVELRRAVGAANDHVTTAAISIDLVSAYAFAGLLFTYSALILILGLSCTFIPAVRAPGVDGTGPVVNTRAAHAKISDFSTLVLEVLDARETNQLRPTLSRHSTAISLNEAAEHSMERRVRLGLRTKSDGKLGLDFHE